MNRRRPSTAGQMAKSRQAYFEAIVQAFEGFIYVCAPDNRIEFANRQATEVLAGIVLTQLIRGGTPVVFAGSSSCSAMRYGTLSIGAPEMAVNTAATAWQQKGALSIDRRANQKWKEILKAYQEPQLPAETDKALRRYIEHKYGA